MANDDTQYNPYVNYNSGWLKRLDTHLNEQNNQTSEKIPKVVELTN